MWALFVAPLISQLFLSHLHSDHIIDIPALIVLRGSGLAAQQNKLQIYGPSGLYPPYGTNATVQGIREVSTQYLRISVLSPRAC